MNEVSLKPVIEELENLFSKFNARFFDGGLEKPVITVSPDHTRGAYGWCTAWLKAEIIDRYLRRLKAKYTVVQLIGFAADETRRLEKKNNQKPNHKHPLVDWGWTEADCLKYCYDSGFDWGGLYKIFHRVSCWCCPLQSLDELRNLRKHFPDLWEKLLDMEHRTWGTFKDRYTVDQLEIRFAFEEERISAGLPINRTREFMSALRKRLEEAGFPQNR